MCQIKKAAGSVSRGSNRQAGEKGVEACMICHATAFPFSLSEYIKRLLGMHESYRTDTVEVRKDF
jgi:cytochrome c553